MTRTYVTRIQYNTLKDLVFISSTGTFGEPVN